jgi:hypothetical protein
LTERRLFSNRSAKDSELLIGLDRDLPWNGRRACAREERVQVGTPAAPGNSAERAAESRRSNPSASPASSRRAIASSWAPAAPIGRGERLAVGGQDVGPELGVAARDPGEVPETRARPAPAAASGAWASEPAKANASRWGRWDTQATSASCWRGGPPHDAHAERLPERDHARARAGVDASVTTQTAPLEQVGARVRTCRARGCRPSGASPRRPQPGRQQARQRVDERRLHAADVR